MVAALGEQILVDLIGKTLEHTAADVAGELIVHAAGGTDNATIVVADVVVAH
jgi:serine/threonine protein phosphatase PrpC